MDVEEKLEQIKKEEKKTLIYGGGGALMQLAYWLITSHYIRIILILSICCGVYFVLLLLFHGVLKILIWCPHICPKVATSKTGHFSHQNFKGSNPTEFDYVFLTPILSSWKETERTKIVNLVGYYENYTAQNDLHKTYSLGSFYFKNELIIWRIVYCDEALKIYPQKPTQRAVKFLFIMTADEYEKCTGLPYSFK